MKKSHKITILVIVIFVIATGAGAVGCDVMVAYLPYSDWRKELNPFDLRRQDLYTKRVLSSMDGLVKSVSLLDPSTGSGRRTRKVTSLPKELEEAVETASAFDTMYTLQVEDFDRDSELYRLRLRMNRGVL